MNYMRQGFLACRMRMDICEILLENSAIDTENFYFGTVLNLTFLNISFFSWFISSLELNYHHAYGKMLTV
jgi:hypothetical protein